MIRTTLSRDTTLQHWKTGNQYSSIQLNSRGHQDQTYERFFSAIEPSRYKEPQRALCGQIESNQRESSMNHLKLRVCLVRLKVGRTRVKDESLSGRPSVSRTKNQNKRKHSPIVDTLIRRDLQAFYFRGNYMNQNKFQFILDIFCQKARV